MRARPWLMLRVLLVERRGVRPLRCSLCDSTFRRLSCVPLLLDETESFGMTVESALGLAMQRPSNWRMRC